MAKELLENKQGGNLRELQIYNGKSPQEHALAEIVIHTVVALQCVGAASLAQPLYALMTDPSTMEVSRHRYVILKKNVLCIGQNNYDKDNSLSSIVKTVKEHLHV